MTFICSKCHQEKPLSEFHKRNGITRGHDSWCKCCKQEYRRSYFLKNRDKEVKRSRIKSWKNNKINISYDDYEKRCVELNHCCEICSQKVEVLHVDHCHTTGKIRGLLCGNCNKALGLFSDSPDMLKQAIKYLVR